MLSTRINATAVALLWTSLAMAQSTRDATQPHPLVAPSIGKIHAVINEGPFRADWDSLESYEIPQWYKDAKFGIFIQRAFQEDQAILKAIGGWLKINGEAIYDTTYWKTFGEGPTSVSTCHVSESKDKPFTAADPRFTARGETLYVTGLAWPGDNRITIKSLASNSQYLPDEIGAVSMLGSDEKLEWTRDENGLTVQLANNEAIGIRLRIESHQVIVNLPHNHPVY